MNQKKKILGFYETCEYNCDLDLFCDFMKKNMKADPNRKRKLVTNHEKIHQVIVFFSRKTGVFIFFNQKNLNFHPKHWQQVHRPVAGAGI